MGHNYLSPTEAAVWRRLQFVTHETRHSTLFAESQCSRLQHPAMVDSIRTAPPLQHLSRRLAAAAAGSNLTLGTLRLHAHTCHRA